MTPLGCAAIAIGIVSAGTACKSTSRLPTPTEAPPQAANTEPAAAVESALTNSGPTAAPSPVPTVAEEPAPTAPAVDPALLDPASANQRAPERFRVRLDTTKGEILIDITRRWAPRGADRFYNLVQEGYFTDVAFFRVVEGFMAQTGLHGDPRVNAAWRTARIADDPVVEHNRRGMVTFATSGPDSRTTQFFINFADNSRLDDMGFAPFGRVRNMTTVDSFFAGYGEGAPGGRGPSQGRIQHEGNAYLRARFPELDYIRSASIVRH